MPDEEGNIVTQRAAAAQQQNGGNFFNPFAIELPEKLDFRDPSDWKRWSARWERYRVVSGLHLRDAETQVNTFLYAMGKGAEDILASLQLTDADLADYTTVKGKFEEHFIPCTNIIFERAKFNRRKQEANESVEAFITDLHKLADTCEYGRLKEDLTRDRLVVGLLDVGLSEKLQLDPKLTLQTATKKARNSEIVKKQQNELRDKAEQGAAVDELRGPKGRLNYGNGPRKGGKAPVRHPTVQTSCKWCGSTRQHSKKQCPAAGKQCHNCRKTGHYATVCLSGHQHLGGEPQQRPFTTKKGTANAEAVFLGELCDKENQEPWFITATVEGRPVHFKVDTGADVSVIPPSQHDNNCMEKPKTPNKRLFGPGRTPIKAKGMFDATISWQGRSTYQQVFIVEGLQTALLGRPAIRALNVLAHLETVETKTQDNQTQKGKSPEARPEFSSLFTGLGEMKTAYRVTLQANATPYAVAAPRRVPVPLLPKVKAELESMEKLGVIRQVDHATPWCAPMVIAKKKNDEIRICVDYGQLNQKVIRERVIMPTVEENLAKLANAKLFSKLDANAGYWQTPLAPESQDLTTFITPFGRFQFLRLPFGIATAPEFFQREMLRILEGLPGQACHQDDIVVFGRDRADHDAKLLAVLQRLKEAGMTLNSRKCEFRKTKIKFLGHVLDSNGIAADPEKTEAIRKMSPPGNTTELRSFLGMVNQLAKFLPGLAEKTKPLRELLLNETSWCWHQPQQRAFDEIKADLTTTPVLCYYNPQKPLTLSADASSYGLGAVLLQTDDEGKRQPVAYASRAMSPTEQRYAQVEKEALAATWACEHFRMYVLGLHFVIETDHKPLVPLFSTKSIDEMTPRLQRFRMRVLEYDFTIVHIPGKDMHTADVLSRKPLQCLDENLASAIEEYELLTIEQLPASTDMLNKTRAELQKDKTTSLVMHYCATKWPKTETLTPEVRKYASVADELSVVHGLLLRGTRLVFPPSLRQEVLERLHTGHQGIVRCRARARESTWWPAISQDIEVFVSRCPACERHRQAPTEHLLQTPLPERPWQVVGTDLFYFKGRNYILAVDYYKFFELEELHGTLTKHVVHFLEDLFARYGIPDIIRSDNGPQYNSLEFAQFLSGWGVEHVTSSPHYAQSNGEAERAVQTAKNILRKSDRVIEGLLAHRATPGPEGYSPAELLMGRKLKTNVPTIPEALQPKWMYRSTYRQRNKAIREREAENYNIRHRTQEREPLHPGTVVYVRQGTQQGTVVGPADTLRSYIVQTAAGNVRRTRKHLHAVPQGNLPNNGKPPCPEEAIQVTRSGRAVRPPERLSL
ncbi:uncharacterized protein K02A2.6-like [Ixodes scapularis]|uniref:uncharacterized protein K02A2.6-like n=1 Tax=Ixodes scapularis TaxID=6945 RepID=UPI001C3856D2|nr:uncharacterized protein K02A2.6-like [Ixodes scapularis]